LFEHHPAAVFGYLLRTDDNGLGGYLGFILLYLLAFLEHGTWER
jgi:hypothetical protein